MDINKILCLGDGFLGNCFKRNGFTVWGRNKFEYPAMVTYFEQALKDDHFNTVINCIGISNTRFCEDPENWALINKINGELPGELSKVCKRYGVNFVHVSSGCVYDRKDGVVTESSPVASHCRYVVSKLIGEYGCDLTRDLIIRPRLLFDSVPVKTKRNNLIQKFSMFSEFLNEFNTVTSNQVIVDSVMSLLDTNCHGVYNCGCTGAYTIEQMATHLGFGCAKSLQDYELCGSQGLVLVNNVMSMLKLIRDSGYTPPDALVELERCNNLLKQCEIND